MNQRVLNLSVVVFLSALLAVGAAIFVGLSSSEAKTNESRAPSQGSLKKGPVIPKEDSPAYSQVVDSGSSKNFEAQGWQTSSKGADLYGQNYLSSDGGESSAKYKFDIPAQDTYSVFAWWPAEAGATSSAKFKINTGNGTESETVNQTKDGGYWVPIGQYEMQKGERYAVELSGSGDGRIVADAVAVVRGVESFPADPEKIGKNSAKASSSGEAMFSAAASGSGQRIRGRAIMRRAKAHLGKRYGNGTCRASARRVDCSCLTRLAYLKWRSLPDSPRLQWYEARNLSTRFSKKRWLKRGDLVFFDENRNGRLEHWDHVGIYAGNGRIIHASTYFGRVVVKEMKYINGYWGGKRLRQR